MSGNSVSIKQGFLFSFKKLEIWHKRELFILGVLFCPLKETEMVKK